MNTPDTELSALRGIGPKKVEAFRKLGVTTLRDLLTLFPRRYEDRSQFRPIALVLPDETVCIRAMVASEPRLVRIRRGMELVKLRAVDESGAVDITFFNQNYRKNNLHPGETYTFYGRVTVSGSKKAMANPVCEPEHSEGHLTGRIVPVYPLTAGLTQRVMLDAVRAALDACADSVPDALPPEIAERYRLAQARFAYENIHFPTDFGALELARRRLIFEELFVLAASMGLMRGRRRCAGGIRMEHADGEEFYRTLPFSPTGAQRRAVESAVQDLSSGVPMNRLIQGDVGSGKTLVAAACIWYVWKSGCQSAFMAPTEILTEQHEATLRGFLAPLGMRVGRLTGSMTAKQKRAVCQALEDGTLDVVVGTHALLRDTVQFHRLGLVVTDEQHRFGVEQRARLSNKSANAPDVLVMTATPIPRTLALTVYGDLDISVMKGRPPQRKPVRTLCYTDERRREVYAGLVRQVQAGRQAYVVCPLIEESDVLAVHSAERVYEELKRDFLQDIPCALLHGRLKGAEKDAIMSSFAAGELKVLVSTTVIEVGVNVPNATLMVIENAERFGLAQLHQLRGRVGRGSEQSYCVLLTAADSPEALARLNVLHESEDGFYLAEKDMEQRGAGQLFGLKQHGLPDLRIADIMRDVDVIAQVRQLAQAQLRTPEDWAEIRRLVEMQFGERFNMIFNT